MSRIWIRPKPSTIFHDTLMVNAYVVAVVAATAAVVVVVVVERFLEIMTQ